MAKFNKQDLILILAIIIIAITIWLGYGIFFNNSDNMAALVSIDGKEVMTIPLNNAEISEFDLNKKFGVDVILKKEGHKIRFLHSDCPDKVCLGFGAIGKEPESAVCMPNKVALVIIKNK